MDIDDGDDDGYDDGNDDGDDKGVDDGDGADVDDSDDREDVGKEDATNSTISSEQDDALELHDSFSNTADDNVHEYSAYLCHTRLLQHR